MTTEQMIQWAKDLWDALSTPLFELSGNRLSVMTFFTALSLFVIFIKVAGVVEKLLRRYLHNKKIDSGVKDSLARFGRYLMISIHPSQRTLWITPPSVHLSNYTL